MTIPIITVAITITTTVTISIILIIVTQSSKTISSNRNLFPGRTTSFSKIKGSSISRDYKTQT